VFNELDATDSKVPGLLGYAGNWSPDGKRLAYFSRPPWGVYTADLTGAADLIFPVQTPGPWRRTIAWSPDGRTLRFAKNDRLYEVSADGKNPHPVFDSPSAPQGAGRWSPDGSRFVYADDWTGDLWSVTEGRGFPAKQEFTRITSGPMQFGTPVLSPDGRTIYAVGQTKRGRLNRYDPGSQSWQPAMGGLSVDGVDYSKDGKFVAYVGFPRRAIGIRRRDGGASRDLTTPPMRGYLPRFSPDGKQVAFMGKMPGQRWRIYLSSVEGSTGESTPRPLPTGANGGEEPNWSPDGSRIVYASVPWDSTGGPNLMYQYDLASGRVSTIPGSEGLFSPRWSPDGRYIAANRFEHYGMNPFVLLDPVSGKRTEFPERMRGVFPAWSRDSRSLYFLNKAPLNPAKVFKLSIDRRTVELVATFQNRIIANSPLPSLDSLWMGLAPDETPLLLEDVGSREIYEILQANMVTSRGRK
jgi:Tol biopolymer transport system component